jgi:hypothetical protein
VKNQRRFTPPPPKEAHAPVEQHSPSRAAKSTSSFVRRLFFTIHERSFPVTASSKGAAHAASGENAD